jgi:hypothetical protein
MTTTTTPFALGVYVGDPNNANLSDEATFENNFNSFVTTMGATPTYFDTYIDYSQPMSAWINNNAWEASSAAASTQTQHMTPTIGLPMWSNAAGSGSIDQQLTAMASGHDDSMLKSMVDQYAASGFMSQVWRPGWEMNLSGPTGISSDATSEADWVAAFQHIYTTLHAEAAKDGVNLQVAWNPGVTNYSNVEATTQVYPGNNYVDIIGADMYGDMYPYSDGTSPATYHDWSTGGEDTSVAQLIANPVDREHYWTDPAATRWSSDSSGGHSLSLDNLIAFAEAHGKPFAVPETGAGNSNAGTDVKDDAAFPTWLAQQLTTAQSAGEKIDFVNIWDSNGGGNYEFSKASDGKPQEAAAWAAAFGGQTTAAAISNAAAAPAPTPVTTVPVTQVAGSGADLLALSIAEDAWMGNAQFTVKVNGAQIGGTFTATASHALGSSQEFDLLGNFAPGPLTVAVDFLNDAWGGTTAMDRNLYVDGASYNNAPVANSALTLLSNGTQSFSFTPVTTTDTLTLQMSEDAWKGNAEFTVEINGKQIGGINTVTALHAQGASQTFSFTGSWGSGTNWFGITFINDAYGGSSSQDRNLYINSATYDGRTVAGAPAALLGNGTHWLDTTPAGSTGAVTVNMAEDASAASAKFIVSVDGVQLGAAQSVSALHSNGASQGFSFNDLLAAGTHDIAVSFVSAAGALQPSTPNLYVTGIAYDGTTLAGSAATLATNGTDHFSLVVPATHS